VEGIDRQPNRGAGAMPQVPKSLQVLLVEDNIVNQQFALALFNRRGHVTRAQATFIQEAT
jgi:CheY-like chemotaxis protein